MSAIPFPAAAVEPTIQDVIAVYCELKLPSLAPPSQALYKNSLAHFAKKFGGRCPSELRASEIEAWLRSIDWADDTKRSTVHRIKAVMNWAVKDDRIKDYRFKALSWRGGRSRRPMTDAEFLRAIRHCPPIFRPFLWLLAWTGCRPGELEGLTWQDIRWEPNPIALVHHKTEHLTMEKREIYLPPVAVRLLRVLERRRIPELFDGVHDYVLMNNKGRSWKSCARAVVWNKIRKAAGLPADCVQYGLRHRFASKSAVVNDITVTAKLLGHGSIQTTAKYYVHLEGEREMLIGRAGSIPSPRSK